MVGVIGWIGVGVERHEYANRVVENEPRFIQRWPFFAFALFGVGGQKRFFCAARLVVQVPLVIKKQARRS